VRLLHQVLKFIRARTVGRWHVLASDVRLSAAAGGVSTSPYRSDEELFVELLSQVELVLVDQRAVPHFERVEQVVQTRVQLRRDAQLRVLLLPTGLGDQSNG